MPLAAGWLCSLVTGENPYAQPKLKALFCFDGWPELRANCASEFAKLGVQLLHRDPSRSLAEQVDGVHILVPTTEPVPGDAIRACKDTLKAIVQPAAGFDAIDTACAKELGVPVCTHGGVNADSVAELTWLLLLGCARRLHEVAATFQSVSVGTPLGWQLRGKTLGVVGMGTIGKKVAAIAEAFGMKVRGTGSKSSPAEVSALLAESDVVSLHCPLVPATRGLVGKKALASMKKGAILVNMARGDVVDYDALVEALKSGHLAAFGADVHWVEPADPKRELYTLPNVFVTPHMGAATHEVFAEMAALVAEDVRQVLKGEELTCELKL